VTGARRTEQKHGAAAGRPALVARKETQAAGRPALVARKETGPGDRRSSHGKKHRPPGDRRSSHGKKHRPPGDRRSSHGTKTRRGSRATGARRTEQKHGAAAGRPALVARKANTVEPPGIEPAKQTAISTRIARRYSVWLVRSGVHCVPVIPVGCSCSWTLVGTIWTPRGNLE